MDKIMNISDILNKLKKNVIWIISTIFVCVGISGVITFFILTPKYDSSSQMIAKMSKDDNNQVNIGDVNSNLMLISTYKDIIKSSLVMEESVRQINDKGYSLSAEELQKLTAVEQAQNSQMFTITVTSSSPKLSQIAANIITEVFQVKVGEVMAVNKVSVIAPASRNTKPITPNIKLNLVIGSFIGLLLGISYILIKDIFDKTVDDEEFITNNLGLLVLGTIPEMNEKELKSQIIKTRIQNEGIGDGNLKRKTKRL